jgi:hypothetical protein
MAHWGWDSQLFNGDNKASIDGSFTLFATGSRIGWIMQTDGWEGVCGHYSIRSIGSMAQSILTYSHTKIIRRDYLVTRERKT